MGNTPVMDYVKKMKDLIYEYQELNRDDRKYRFTEYVQKETDIFIEINNKEKIENISESGYDALLDKRTAYIKELFHYKDVCKIF